MFASSNTNSNCNIVYDYIVSRIYDVDFLHQSNSADKEALFIPSGYDSKELISQTTDIGNFLKKSD